MRRKTFVKLSGSPPGEFRIFQSGWNESSKGRFLFDADSAASLMATYRKEGHRVMIDLEHLSLDQESNSFDPDARGWCDLELRNGELWAVRVAWTPDGKRRLTEATQQYISPAFAIDADNKRITSLYNIAICAIPATYEIPSLVAASKRNGKSYVTLSIEVKPMDEMKKIAEALGLQDDATLEDILSAVKAMREDESEEEDGAESEALKAQLRKALKLADDASDEEVEKAMKKMADEPDGDDEEKEALAKLPPKLQAKVMASLYAKPDVAMSKRIAELEAKQHKDEIEKLMSDNAAKIPPTLEAWARKQSPEALRVFLKHAAPATATVAVQPKQESESGKVELTAEEKSLCKLQNIKPEDLVAYKKKQADKAAA